MACNKCQKVTNDSDHIVCRGYCGNSFHMICVKLDYSLRGILKDHDKNLLWMCDDCAELFSSDYFRKMSSRCTMENVPDETSIKSLKDDIAGLKEIVSTLSSKVDAQPTTPLLSVPWPGTNSKIRHNTVPNTPKRVRDDGFSREKPSNSRGTKPASEMIRTVAPPEELFWVYLSAFDPNTSENDMVEFVKNCMELTADVEPKAVKLVPKDKDLSTLSFVTFKIGVNKSLKDVALSKDTWPENVYFREFENHSKNQRRVIRVSTGKSPHSGQ
ncbi:AAEL017170-PA [Aedes aegypti]|uniref:AAEL017170-PA n=1 Tax=Aedes aegypti TaxID=7159 RepID=J9HYE9_AEDAE|nr:AAEL017170-PA [Aedes aegypti]